MLRLLILSTFFLCSSTSLVAQVTPEEYFGESYADALRYCIENRNDFVYSHGPKEINSALACAVIFPELIRYNRFRDYMETSALELAYVSGGKGVADFSIGRFQMKPSFVEMLEKELSENADAVIGFENIVEYPSTLSDQEIRKERIARLKRQEWQNIYLRCFMSLTIKKFKNEIGQNPSEDLLILSSAYNLGLNASYDDLKRIAEQKTFPYGVLNLGRFSYFDVANYFYTNHSTLILSKL